MQTSKPKSRTVLLSGTILAAAVFVGSTILYSTNNLVGEIGMISSAVIMALAIVLKEH